MSLKYDITFENDSNEPQTLELFGATDNNSRNTNVYQVTDSYTPSYPANTEIILTITAENSSTINLSENTTPTQLVDIFNSVTSDTWSLKESDPGNGNIFQVISSFDYLNSTLEINLGTAQWSVLNLGITDDITGIYAIDSSNIVFCTSGGSIFKSSDGGGSFSEVFSNASLDFNDIDFGTSLVGYAIDQGGDLYKTIDGGDNWSFQINVGSLTSYNTLSFSDENEGYVAGSGAVPNVVRKTTDAGTSFVSQSTGNSNTILSIYSIGSNDAWYTGSANNRKNTQNGGSTWNFQQMRQGYEVFMLSTSLGWITDSNTAGQIARTTDGFTAVGTYFTTSTSIQLYGIHFYDSNNGLAVGGNGSDYVIISSNDGGLTWSTALQDAGEILRRVKVINANLAFAVGDNGLILRYA